MFPQHETFNNFIPRTTDEHKKDLNLAKRFMYKQCDCQLEYLLNYMIPLNACNINKNMDSGRCEREK